MHALSSSHRVMLSNLYIKRVSIGIFGAAYQWTFFHLRRQLGFWLEKNGRALCVWEFLGRVYKTETLLGHSVSSVWFCRDVHYHHGFSRAWDESLRSLSVQTSRCHCRHHSVCTHSGKVWRTKHILGRTTHILINQHIYILVLGW